MSHPNEPVEQVPTKVCRKCSVQSTTTGGFCPNCGASYEQRRRPSRKAALISAAVVVVILAAAAGGYAKYRHDVDVREASEAAEAAAVEQQRLDEQTAQEEADEAERETRREAVAELEKLIRKDARKKARSGVLDGPILEASCTATGGGSMDDLTALTGTFDCIAVTKNNKDGTQSGYGYVGTLDWESGTATWQLDF